MIKQGVVNFFKNLKYFFTPLGTIFLGVLFGVCFLFSGFKTQVAVAAKDIQTITEEANISVDDLKNCVVDSFSQLNWNRPLDALKKATSKEWLDGTLKVNLENTIENYKLYAEDIERAVKKAISGYAKYVVAFALCALLGLIGGFFLTGFLIRRNIARRNFWKMLLVTLVDSILTAGATALTLWLTMLWKPSVLVASVIGIIIYGFISLFEAYLVHGNKKLPFGQIVNIKNIFKLFVANMVIYLISMAIAGLAVALTNEFVGAFIGLPLLIVGIIVISLNAEVYVKGEVASAKAKQAEQKQAAQAQN